MPTLMVAKPAVARPKARMALLATWSGAASPDARLPALRLARKARPVMPRPMAPSMSPFLRSDRA